jgi:hypothetical protein
MVFPLSNAPDRFSRLQSGQRADDTGEFLFARLFEPCNGKTLSRKDNVFNVAEDLFHLPSIKNFSKEPTLN